MYENLIKQINSGVYNIYPQEIPKEGRPTTIVS